MKENGTIKVYFTLIVSFIFFFTFFSLLLDPPAVKGVSKTALLESFRLLMFDARQNLRLLFQGSWDGYGRTLIGYSLFTFMAAFFLGVGRVCVLFILGPGAGQEGAISAPERMALSYLLGSLAASLLWFGLGYAGLLRPGAAAVACLAGPVILALTLKKWPLNLKSAAKHWRALRAWEKAGIAVAVLILLLHSMTAVQLQEYADSAAIHLALPQSFIGQGRMAINPFHFHSYLPQNTEMLVMWALLLKSEFAAVLIPWGFWACWAALLWGFVSRHTSSQTALLTLFVFLSIPVARFSATYVKNDMAGAAFLFAHYWALVEALSPGPKAGRRRWAFLTGILCGGSIGHKFLPHAAVITFLAFLIYDGLKKNDPESGKFLFPYWLGGASLVLFPWLLRTFLATGNPIFPFFQKFFGRAIPDPLYSGIETLHDFNTSWAGFKSYISDHLILAGNSGVYAIGACSLFIFLIPLLLSKGPSRSIRAALYSALLSLVCLLFWLNPRFHMGLWVFLICIPFAWIYESVQAAAGRRVKIFAAGTILLCLIGVSSSWGRVFDSLYRVLSGNPPGNFLQTRIPFGEPGKTRWINYLINTRTRPGEKILYAGISMPFPLERESIFGSEYNRDPFEELVKVSTAPADLKMELRRRKVDHIVARSWVNPKTSGVRVNYRSFRREIPQAYIEKQDMLADFFAKEMDLRFQSPDRQIAWYSFKGGSGPVTLNERDARAYPGIVMEEADSQSQRGNPQKAVELLEMERQVPMSLKNRLAVLTRLADLYETAGEISKADEVAAFGRRLAPWWDPWTPKKLYALGFLNEKKGPAGYAGALEMYRKAIELKPDDSRSFNQMGNIYFELQDFKRSEECYLKVLEIEPLSFQAYNNLGNILYAQRDLRGAIAFYQKAILLNGDYSTAYFNLGNAYRSLLQPALAEDMFTIARDLETNRSRPSGR